MRVNSLCLLCLCFLCFPDFLSIILCFESCASPLLLDFVLVPYIFVDSCDVGHHFRLHYNNCLAFSYLFCICFHGSRARSSSFLVFFTFLLIIICSASCASRLLLVLCFPICLSIYSMLCIISVSIILFVLHFLIFYVFAYNLSVTVCCSLFSFFETFSKLSYVSCPVRLHFPTCSCPAFE